MNRTTRQKSMYLGLMALAIGAGFVLARSGASIGVWVALVVLLLIPSRVQGYLWRNFFRGRRLLAAQQYDASIGHFRRFLDELRARPALKHLIWLGWGMYTRDIEVMTRTNLGAAYLETNNLDQAEGQLRLARELDPNAPTPLYNLGVVHERRGESELAASAFLRARELGYSGGRADALIRATGGSFARVEGAGTSSGVDV